MRKPRRRKPHSRITKARIRKGIEQLENRVLPGGFLDLLVSAAFASQFDLMGEEELEAEEQTEQTRSAIPRPKPAVSTTTPLAIVTKLPEPPFRVGQPGPNGHIGPNSSHLSIGNPHTVLDELSAFSVDEVLKGRRSTETPVHMAAPSQPASNQAVARLGGGGVVNSIAARPVSLALTAPLQSPAILGEGEGPTAENVGMQAETDPIDGPEETTTSYGAHRCAETVSTGVPPTRLEPQVQMPVGPGTTYVDVADNTYVYDSASDVPWTNLNPKEHIFGKTWNTLAELNDLYNEVPSTSGDDSQILSVYATKVLQYYAYSIPPSSSHKNTSATGEPDELSFVKTDRIETVSSTEITLSTESSFDFGGKIQGVEIGTAVTTSEGQKFAEQTSSASEAARTLVVDVHPCQAVTVYEKHLITKVTYQVTYYEDRTWPAANQITVFYKDVESKYFGNSLAEWSWSL